MAISALPHEINYESWASSLTIDKPSGLAEGDAMIACIMNGEGTDNLSSAPSGWTKIDEADPGTTYLWFFTKQAGASEPANYTWSFTGNETINGAIIAFTGVNTTSCFGNRERQAYVNWAEDIIAPSVVIQNTGNVAVSLVASLRTDGITAVPAGTPVYTQIFDDNIRANMDMAAWWATYTSTGATGDKEATCSSGAIRLVQHFELIVASDTENLVTKTGGITPVGSAARSIKCGRSVGGSI